MKIFDQSGTLLQLHDQLTKSLRNEIPFDKKKFTPHITLGRVKGRLPMRKKVSIESGHIDSVFPVETLELVESKLTPIGPLYSTIITYTLGNGKTL